MLKRLKQLNIVQRLSLLLLIAMPLCRFAGSTWAWQKSTDTQGNNFEVENKNVNIRLIEPNWDSTGAAQAAAYVPGMDIYADPQVQNLSEEQCYVRMKYNILYADGTEVSDKDYYVTYSGTQYYIPWLTQLKNSLVYYEGDEILFGGFYDILDGDLTSSNNNGYSEASDGTITYYDKYVYTKDSDGNTYYNDRYYNRCYNDKNFTYNDDDGWYYYTGDDGLCKILEGYGVTRPLFTDVTLPILKTNFDRYIYYGSRYIGNTFFYSGFSVVVSAEAVFAQGIEDPTVENVKARFDAVAADDAVSAASSVSFEYTSGSADSASLTSLSLEETAVVNSEAVSAVSSVKNAAAEVNVSYEEKSTEEDTQETNASGTSGGGGTQSRQETAVSETFDDNAEEEQSSDISGTQNTGGSDITAEAEESGVVSGSAVDVSS